jgi:hypothetical protein
MSMIGNYLRVSAKQLEEIHREPSGIMNLLYPNGETDHATGTHLDIDKAWHGIHFLLNGEPWGETAPGLGFIVVGGSEIGEDAGYGPVRGFSSPEVKLIHRALETIDGTTLVERFDAEGFERNEVYPSGDWKDVQDLGYWSGYFDELKAFIGTAAEKNQALLVWLG